MSADIVDLGLLRQARGLPAVHRVDPASLFLPPAGKRIGDRVRTAWGALGTVIAALPGSQGCTLFVITARGNAVVADHTVEAVP